MLERLGFNLVRLSAALVVGATVGITGFAWAQESDYQTVIAGVTRVNARALTFYIKYGFSIMDQPAQTDSERIYFMKVVR